MSWSSYRDLKKTSPSGNFIVTAISPDNGTIPTRDGSPPDPETLGYKSGHEQSGFRFQLRDAASQLVWERWQPEREPSPLQLHVSDSGWVVICTAGYRNTYLIAVSLEGLDTITVTVTDSGSRHPTEEPNPAYPCRRIPPNSGFGFNTRGLRWLGSSASFFLADKFWILPLWGERIALSLREGCLLEEASPPAADVDCEQTFASRALCQSQDSDCLQAALGIVVRQRLSAALPDLLTFQKPFEYRGRFTLCGLPPKFYVQGYNPQAMVNLALSVLGRHPTIPSYTLTIGFQEAGSYPLPAPRPGRHASLHELGASQMEPLEVLQLAGSPDFADGDLWDYYLPASGGWLTLTRVHWLTELGKKPVSRIYTVKLADDDLQQRVTDPLGA